MAQFLKGSYDMGVRFCRGGIAVDLTGRSISQAICNAIASAEKFKISKFSPFWNGPNEFLLHLPPPSNGIRQPTSQLTMLLLMLLC
jgi:hypothetical protein